MAQATLGRLYTAKTLTDRKVINTAGDRLGEIQDFVIDVTRGGISYAVLSYSGGFLNMSRKHFAVPWEAFRIDEAHRDLVLDIDEARLKDSPGFDRDEWPAEPDETFAESVHSYYGYNYPPTYDQRGMSGQAQGSTQQGGVQQGGYEQRGAQGYQQGDYGQGGYGPEGQNTGQGYGSGTSGSEYPGSGEDEDVNRGNRW